MYGKLHGSGRPKIGTSTQIPGSSEQPADSLPAQWDLQACIDYALQQNITIRKNRLSAESAQVDVRPPEPLSSPAFRPV